MSDILLHVFLYYMYEWKQWQKAKKKYTFSLWVKKILPLLTITLKWGQVMPYNFYFVII